MGKLATSNLSVKSLLTMLGVTTPKEIFYVSGFLRTVGQLQLVVNKLWLGAECPGADPDSKIASLLADRKLSYFKGYGFVENFLMYTSYGLGISRITAPWITERYENICGINSTGLFYQEGFGTSQMSIALNGSYPGFNLYLKVYIDDVLQTSLTQTITSLATKYVTLPTAMSYPQVLRITISS